MNAIKPTNQERIAEIDDQIAALAKERADLYISERYRYGPPPETDIRRLICEYTALRYRLTADFDKQLAALYFLLPPPSFLITAQQAAMLVANR